MTSLQDELDSIRRRVLALQVGFDGDSVEIEGSADALLALAELLETEILRAGRIRVTPSSIWVQPIDVLACTDTDSGLIAAPDSTCLNLSGSVTSFASLAGSIRFLVENVRKRSSSALALPSDHLHVEWYPDHPWIDPHSIPIIVSIKR